jgi:hypothetical protein
MSLDADYSLLDCRCNEDIKNESDIVMWPELGEGVQACASLSGYFSSSTSPSSAEIGKRLYQLSKWQVNSMHLSFEHSTPWINLWLMIAYHLKKT